MAGKQLLGREGMRLLEYVGGNRGSGVFWGPVTGARYKFGDNPKDKIKHVDNRDYAGMLEMWKNRRPVFSAYVVPKAAPDLELTAKEVERIKGDLTTGEVQDMFIQAVVDATPYARKRAEQEGLDLSTVKGSGKDGRITKQDVLDAIAV